MRFLSTLRSLVLGMWVGGILVTGMIAAPVIFAKSGSKTLAGSLFGEVLRGLNRFELACWLLLAVLQAILVYRAATPVGGGPRPRGRFWKRVPIGWRYSSVLLLLMFCTWFYYARVLTPEMATLKAAIPSCDVEIAQLENDPARSRERQARQRFEVLHRRYSRAMQANLILGVIMVLIPRKKQQGLNATDVA